MYSPLNISRPSVNKSERIRHAKHAAPMGGMRIAYDMIVGKPGGYRPLGRPRIL